MLRILLRAVSLLVPVPVFASVRDLERQRCCSDGTDQRSPEYWSVLLRGTGLAVRRLPQSARRLIAALWFAIFAWLGTSLFFLPLAMAPHAVILYIVFPALAAGIAGYSWGGAILDPSRIKTYRQTVLRALIVSAGTYLIFAMFYACGLPMLEGGWSLRRAGSLYLLTLTLGILEGGPLAATTGVAAGVTLFKFGRHFFAETEDPVTLR